MGVSYFGREIFGFDLWDRSVAEVSTAVIEIGRGEAHDPKIPLGICGNALVTMGYTPANVAAQVKFPGGLPEVKTGPRRPKGFFDRCFIGGVFAFEC